MGRKTAGGADIDRRQFMLASAGALGALWRPVRRMSPSEPGVRNAPAAFPDDIALSRTAYENWACEIRVDDVWSAEVTTPQDVVRLANWAAAHGWRIRPSGARHGWAPLTVTPGQGADAQVVIVNTAALDAFTIDAGARTVTAQVGVLMNELMPALSAAGLGFTSIPAIGAVTLGGVLAVNGHGAAVPAAGEDPRGRNYGSMSNLIVSLEAVVWDPATRAYRIRRFDRGEPVTAALLTSLGRVFVTSVVLRAEPDTKLRCVSYTDVTTRELFAEPGSNGRTFASYLEATGRVESILFPFTDRPWLKVWSLAPKQPPSSRKVAGPDNYPFSDNVPLAAARQARTFIANHPRRAVEFGRTMLAVAERGLDLGARDLWGPAHCTQHYIKASTLRAAELGYAILTARANVQRVLHDLVSEYRALTQAYAKLDQYPANLPLELRCTGVDDAAYPGVPGARTPVLSSTSPQPNRPEWDTVVFANSLSFVGSPGTFAFHRDLERWIVRRFDGTDAIARVEWSKCWAYTHSGGWRNQGLLSSHIPTTFRAGRRATESWDWAVAEFDRLDPANVFGNPLLDRLF